MAREGRNLYLEMKKESTLKIFENIYKKSYFVLSIKYIHVKIELLTKMARFQYEYPCAKLFEGKYTMMFHMKEINDPQNHQTVPWTITSGIE